MTIRISTRLDPSAYVVLGPSYSESYLSYPLWILRREAWILRMRRRESLMWKFHEAWLILIPRVLGDLGRLDTYLGSTQYRSTRAMILRVNHLLPTMMVVSRPY